MSELIIYETPQKKNRCYIRAAPAKQVGILVHSTGAINRELRRYVDAEDVLGKNQYNNHWNRAEMDKCMHAFIGYDKNKAVAVAHTLPYEYACWGCGQGVNGSYNYNPTAHIQFEICEGSETDAEYYWKAIAVAEMYCTYLCKQYGFTAADICSHKEAAKAGYASNHGDPESWMKHFGDNMANFRSRVGALIGDQTEVKIVEGGEQSTETGDLPGSGGADGIDAATMPSAMPVLRRGTSGEIVQSMQRLLIAHGAALPLYGADGDFGAETDAAVRAFQRSRGLDADGVCGVLTWAALMGTIPLYTVTLLHVPESRARALAEEFPGAELCAEVCVESYI